MIDATNVTVGSVPIVLEGTVGSVEERAGVVETCFVEVVDFGVAIRSCEDDATNEVTIMVGVDDTDVLDCEVMRSCEADVIEQAPLVNQAVDIELPSKVRLPEKIMHSVVVNRLVELPQPAVATTVSGKGVEVNDWQDFELYETVLLVDMRLSICKFH